MNQDRQSAWAQHRSPTVPPRGRARNTAPDAEAKRETTQNCGERGSTAGLAAAPALKHRTKGCLTFVPSRAPTHACVTPALCRAHRATIRAQSTCALIFGAMVVQQRRQRASQRSVNAMPARRGEGSGRPLRALRLTIACSSIIGCTIVCSWTPTRPKKASYTHSARCTMHPPAGAHRWIARMLVGSARSTTRRIHGGRMERAMHS